MRRVQLRAAKIPWLGLWAIHPWYVILAPQSAPERWEIWQSRGLRQESWGHLYKNLLPWEAGVGNGPSWLLGEWGGDRAEALIEILQNSPQIYPYRDLYRYVPGPNSNTYARWVLSQAQLPSCLDWRAIGQNFARGKSPLPLK
ncbi:MAG: DUF3750 domain-containing protein [Cyanobacteriota bacterium]